MESPILYTGSKRRLINKGLIELFPSNIDTFIDLFCGGGSVSLNVEANMYYMNDKCTQITSLLKLFQETEPIFLTKNIEEIILKYNLEENIINDLRKPTEYHKEKYLLLRNEYNKYKNPLYLYVLIIYSFCHQIRFNSNNEFNMPCGNGHFSKELKSIILNSNSFFNSKNYTITNNDFRVLKPCNLSENDFVYLDPPYFNTTATYNENGGWTENDENDLYKLCEELNNCNIKFAMSNVFSNKGITNEKLIEWCKKNNWNVHYFDNFTYSACGKGNGKTVEVLIMNY